MKSLKILSILPIVALLAACGDTQVKVSNPEMASEKQTQAPSTVVVYPDDRPSIPDGHAVWDRESCASCHGADGVGVEGKAKKSLADKEGADRVKPVETYKFLAYGDATTGHPALLTKMSNREVWNLVFYTRSFGNAPLPQKELDEIAPVFGANCAVCHGTKGDGDGPLARNLEPWPANFQSFKRFYDRTDEVLFDHIANGIKWEGMPNFLGKEDKKKNFKFDHKNIGRLVKYVRNFHVSNTPTIPLSASGIAPVKEAAPAEKPPEKSTETPATTTSEPAKTDTAAGDAPATDAAPASTATGEATSTGASESGDKAGESKPVETK